MGLMHSCRQAAALISRALDEPLGLVDRARLKLHLLMCGDCHNVERQTEELHRLVREWSGADETDALASTVGARAE